MKRIFISRQKVKLLNPSLAPFLRPNFFPYLVNFLFLGHGIVKGAILVGKWHLSLILQRLPLQPCHFLPLSAMQVKVISVKQCLDWALPKQQCAFLQQVLVLVAPGVLLHLSKIKIVFFWVRYERRFYIFFVELWSGEVTEPHVWFHFFRAVQAEPVYWFSLQKFVDKVCCFKWPIRRHIIFFQLDLPREDLVSNFFSVSPLIRSSSSHKLEADHSDCEIINSDSVVLSAHDFRSHVARSPARVLRIVRMPSSCDPQICDPQVSIFIQH